MLCANKDTIRTMLYSMFVIILNLHSPKCMLKEYIIITDIVGSYYTTLIVLVSQQ